MKKLLLLAGVISVGVVGAQARPTATNADWTFESLVTPFTAGPYSPETGSGSATGVHAGAAVFSSPSGNGSSHSYSANTWAVGDYWQFQTSTVGFQNINVSYDQTGSSTGPKTFGFAYSTDGTTFTQVGSDYSVTLSSWSPATVNPAFTFTEDLSSVTALNGASAVYFRIFDDSTVSIGNGVVAAGGTDRTDNFVVSSDPVPEPSSLCLMGGLGVLAVTMARRRR